MSGAGKGDKNRVADLNSYRDNFDKINFGKKEETYADFSNNFIEKYPELYDENKPKVKRFLMLDDVIFPENAWLYDENQYLLVYSKIPKYKWDIVRSYNEFVTFVEQHGIPEVVSFDNDLDPAAESYFIKTTLEGHPFEYENANPKMGIHCAQYLVEKCKKLEVDIPRYFVHSANSLARPIIREIMENAKVIKN